MTAQTFRPAPKRLVGPALTVAVFVAWTIVAFVFVPRAEGPRPALGMAFLGGVPLLMALGSAVLLLGLLARTTVDDEGLTIAGPLGTRRAAWADVVGWDVVGTAKGGVTLTLRSGRRLGVPYLAYEGDAIRKAVDERLRRLPRPDVEGVEFRIEGRWGLAALMVGGLLFFVLAVATTPARSQTQVWAILGVMVLCVVPLSVGATVDRMTLKGGVLIHRSLLGTRRLALADVAKAELRVVNGKGGAREALVLRGPTTIHLTAQREGYAMLRDAVVRALPPGVRPKPLG